MPNKMFHFYYSLKGCVKLIMNTRRVKIDRVSGEFYYYYSLNTKGYFVSKELELKIFGEG